MATLQIEIPREQLADFCVKHHIRKLSLFGSVLRDDFRPDSDVDVLVEFEAGYRVGFKIGAVQTELSELLGREVHVSTRGSISDYFVDHVINSAKVEYERN